VEDEGGLIGVFREHLVQHVQEDAQKQKTGNGDADLRGQSKAREPLGQRAPKVLDETHPGSSRREERAENEEKEGIDGNQEPSACCQSVSRTWNLVVAPEEKILKVGRHSLF
jgi:hypothetical protein